MEYVAFFFGVLICGAALYASMKLRPSKRAGATPVVHVDPFGVGDPWRRYVASAQSAQRRYSKIVGGLDDGPLRTRMAEIGHQVEKGVEECWAIAKRGDLLDDTIRNLDGGSLRNRLEMATDDSVRTSLQNQLASLDRVRSARDQTDRRLNELSTRLGELVSQAAEVSSGVDGTEALGSAVDDVVVQLQSLGTAVEEMNTAGRSKGFEAGPGTPTPAT